MIRVSSPFANIKRRLRLKQIIREQLEALPSYLVDGLGPGEFVDVGESVVDILRSEGKLRRGGTVLDIGCGLGRVAIPLQRYLTRGTYDGFDIVPQYVHWAESQITSRSPNFRFRLADIHSSMYNPESVAPPASVTFPYPDNRFTVAVATSLFSHLLPDATVRYFAETARVLRRRGRAVFTFFLLDRVSRQRAETLDTYPTFGYAFEHGLLNDPQRPEEAVAYDAEWVLQALEEARLTPVLPVHWGRWSGRANALSYQDVVIAERT
jgi:SAM-dependent methyltransferase